MIEQNREFSLTELTFVSVKTRSEFQHPQIMNQAEKRSVARLALKGAAHHALENRDDRVREKCWYAPIEDRDLMKLALRWTLSLPITAAVPPGDPELWQMSVEVAQDFTPITPDEELHLRENARGRKPLFELATS